MFCNITNKVLKSNGKFLILPFMRDPCTCERERVCTSYVFSEHFYTGPYGLTEIPTILQCSLKSPYTNSEIYSYAEYLSDGLPVPTPIRPFLHTGLHNGLRIWSDPTDRSQPIGSSACSADGTDVELVSQHTSMLIKST